MYDVLSHLGDLFFQGLFSCLLVFGLTRWYDHKLATRKSKAAALFIAVEMMEHLILLLNAVKNKKFSRLDDEVCFHTECWKEFRGDIVPLLGYGDLSNLAVYYRSITIILIAIKDSEPYSNYESTVVSALDNAKYFCALLWKLAASHKNLPNPVEEILAQNQEV